MRSANKLSAVAVAKMSKPGCYADGRGLYLQVAPGGSKSWLLRYMRDGRARKMGLGPVHLVTLAMARTRALEAQRKLLDDIDPIDERQEARAARRVAKASGITFKDAATRYIAAHRAGWKNAKHGAQWGSTLEAYVYPIFGDLPVAAVDVGLVLKALEPIWTTKAETASRVRGRIESILDWATARNYRTGENPARWKGHLDKLLPARSKVQTVKHHPALPYAEMGAFMAKLRGMEGIGPRALEFAILTAARTGEVVGAEWREIDPDTKLWTIPAGRMKAKKEHRVPLSPRALEILKSLRREDDNEFCFIGDKHGKGLSNMALLMTLRRMEAAESNDAAGAKKGVAKAEITAHGFRSSFKDWASETTGYPNDLVEVALAHTLGNAVEAAYKRGDQLEKRRRLMADWAAFCAQPARSIDVVPIRGTRDA